jgi:CHASE3 domain sensor protein
MSTGRGAGTHESNAAGTQAASRAERMARRLQVPLIVAALLALPTIVVLWSCKARQIPAG